MSEAREQGRRLLEFMEEVTASATHEIKNELAVINEQSRLVAEMLEMGRRGREPDPGRLEQLIGRVIARVGRADAAVRRLNAFSHSAGGAAGCDAARCLELMTQMYARPAGQQDLTVEVVEAPDSLAAAMPALDCERLVWAALGAVAAAAARGTVLRVSLQARQGRGVLRVAGELEHSLQPLPPGLLETLGVGVRVEGGALELELPISGAAKEHKP